MLYRKNEFSDSATKVQKEFYTTKLRTGFFFESDFEFLFYINIMCKE